MRQKYLITQDTVKNNLKIREYAIIHKDLQKTETSMLRHTDYSLLYEEIYDSAKIIISISKGSDDLLETLRTPNMFPIASNAALIVEAVKSLYDSTEDNSVELFFDDIDEMQMLG